MRAPYLVPGVGSVCRVNEQGQDLGPGQQSRGPFGNRLSVEVVGAFLKHEVWPMLAASWTAVFPVSFLVVISNVVAWCSSRTESISVFPSLALT